MCTSKKFDWTDIIRRNILILRLVGLWPNGSQNYRHNLYGVYAFTSIIIPGASIFFQIMNIFYVYDDLEALSSTVFITVASLQTLVKMCIFVKNIGLFKKLIQLLNGNQLNPKNESEIKIVKPLLKFWKAIYLIYCSTALLSVCVITVIPMFSKSESKKLPFAAWYPYNYTVSPLFELTYLYQTSCAWFITVANIHMDTIIVALMVYIVAQCDILRYNFENLTNSGEKFHDVNKTIVGFVKYHKNILSFAEDSNKFSEVIIVLQLFTSTFILAATMFELTIVSPVSKDGLLRIMYGSAMTCQIFMYCWFGNEIETKVRYMH
ncbi:hypothetical protein Zmor_007616 [Zophobas morio]|uniref:Odorant receptor n=1 Tax=Zophobas morio TaxID=2755281 RepID=A0AA38IVU4_9CUCU|nr:hypothetical protein Zmor_007616 [Zophobas morio]